MNDGRLGLIDYGMVGRLTTTDRKLVASTVLAFVSGDKDKVVDNYLSSGYRAGWITAPSSATGAEASSTSSVTITKRRYEHTNHTIYRFAKFHLDRIDLSPIPVETATTTTVSPHHELASEALAVLSGGNSSSTTSGLFHQSQSTNDEKTRTITTTTVVHWPVLKLLSKSMEFEVPNWIQQMKRIGGLLIGVASQAGRPISLSKEWYPIAKQCMKELESEHREHKTN